MRKVILQMQITLDGFVCGPNEELDWLDYDPVMGQAHYELAKNADAALIGHNVAEGMAGFWPSMATNPDAPPNEVEFAKLMNDMQKIVFSTKEDKLDWANTTTCTVTDDDDLVRQVQEMKQQPGTYLILYGGVRTAQTFIKHGLVDEYRFDMCPVALGAGKAIFTDRTNLKLIESTAYASGAIGLVYQPAPKY
jgi:dihydrofolate reductase